MLTASVGLERPADERSAVWIELYDVDEVSIDFDLVIEITELGAAVEAAVLSFVQHLHGDIAAIVFDGLGVRPVRDEFLKLRGVLVIAVFLGRGNELDTESSKSAFDFRGVVVVAECARARVDDDVVDVVRILRDVSQKSLEGGAVGDVLC